MVWLQIGVGNDHVHKQWFPNSYLGDVLLGVDVLAKAPFHWNGKTNIILWGNTPYVTSHIKRQKGKVERISFRVAVLSTKPTQRRFLFPHKQVSIKYSSQYLT